MIAVRLKYLPDDAATVHALDPDHDPWTRTEVLLAHVWQAAAQSRKPHPWLTEAQQRERRRRHKVDAAKRARLDDVRRRAIERRRRLGIGS